MDKRYQIFVSSTFTDLKTERQAVTQALLTLDHFPAGMELFPASNDDQWTLIKGVIDDSDYYLLVIGGRYGSISEDGVSYTEKEFDYAVTSGIPILAFLHDDPESIPAKNTDQNDAARAKLLAFREKVKSGRTVKMWSTPENLEARVMQAVSAETKKNPREGWVRGGLSSDPVRMNQLLQEIDELKSKLASARTLPPPGAEAYAQGEEEFKVIYRYRNKYMDPFITTSIILSWNQIFYEIGPVIIDEAPEAKIRLRLSDELHLYETDRHAFKPNDLTISTDSFETIKIQLVAIGLMRKSEKKHTPSDSNVYWQATPFGEQYCMRLRALRKGQSNIGAGEDDENDEDDGIPF